MTIAHLTLTRLGAGAVALVAFTSCGSPSLNREVWAGTAFSALPNIGAALSAGQVYYEDDEVVRAFEMQGTYQPFDDEDLINDGNPGAGDFFQIQLGTRNLLDPAQKRKLVWGAGVCWMRFGEDPNITNDPGDYKGMYGSIGFVSEVGGQVSLGPEFTLLLVEREKTDDLLLLVQLSWRIDLWL